MLHPAEIEIEQQQLQISGVIEQHQDHLLLAVPEVLDVAAAVFVRVVVAV